MWETIIGGVIALVGSFGAMWFQSRRTLRARMDEITAERKVIANGEAYNYIKYVEAAHLQDTPEKAANVAHQYESWLFANRLFLPSEFVSNWLSLRTNLHTLARQTKSSTSDPKKLENLDDKISAEIGRAIDAIYEDMNMNSHLYEMHNRHSRR